MRSMADDFVFSQHDAQRLIRAAGPAEQHAALGVSAAAEAFDLDAFELNAIVDVKKAKQATTRLPPAPLIVFV